MSDPRVITEDSANMQKANSSPPLIGDNQIDESVEEGTIADDMAGSSYAGQVQEKQSSKAHGKQPAAVQSSVPTPVTDMDTDTSDTIA
ncbi:hypothetical protein SARC_17173, partial [Sphaeroforma arctica JP610]